MFMYKTVYGELTSENIKEFAKVAGWQWGNKYQSWGIIKEMVNTWIMNKAENLRKNESRWFRKDNYITIRDLNFQFAYYSCKCDINKTIKFAKMYLFDKQGKPVYLPDMMAEKKGLDLKSRHFNYNAIIKEAQEAYNEDRKPDFGSGAGVAIGAPKKVWESQQWWQK